MVSTSLSKLLQRQRYDLFLRFNKVHIILWLNIVRIYNFSCVCFLRVTTITERLEREEEGSFENMVARLARLEEQVVTCFFSASLMLHMCL